MDKDILDGFQQAIVTRRERDESAQLAAKRETDRIQGMETDWIAKRDKIVMPALREIEELLKASGWVARAHTGEKETAIASLEIYRGNMRSTGRGRPNITFSLDQLKKGEVVPHLATTSFGGSIKSIPLSGLTTKIVQAAALEFFAKLSAERDMD